MAKEEVVRARISPDLKRRFDAAVERYAARTGRETSRSGVLRLLIEGFVKREEEA